MDMYCDPSEFEQSDEHMDEHMEHELDIDLFDDASFDILGDEFDEWLDGLNDVHVQGHSDIWTDLNQINPDDVPF